MSLSILHEIYYVSGFQIILISGVFMDYEDYGLGFEICVIFWINNVKINSYLRCIEFDYPEGKMHI